MNSPTPVPPTESANSIAGLAILGRRRFEDHASIATRTAGLRLVGYAADGEAVTVGLAEEVRCHPTPSAAIDDAEVEAVVVNVETDEREYWVKRAAEAGKHVLCDTPVVPTFSKARCLVSSFEANGLTFALTDELFYSAIADRSRKTVSEGTLGRLLFVDAKVSVPRRWLAPRSAGVMLEYGSSTAVLLQEIIGRLDTAHGRTRSFGVNRPEEDVAVANLGFVNGVEGILQVCGLGERSELEIEIHGSAGSATFLQQLPIQSRDGLARIYEGFSRALRGERPTLDAQVLQDSLFIVDWIQQSARLGREISRKEVKLG